MNDEEMRAITYLYLTYKFLKMKRKRKQSRYIYGVREKFGHYHTLVPQMRLHDHDSFIKFFRMTPEKFDLLLSYVGPIITKSSKWRKPISAGERLAITLRFLASGEEMQDISFNFRVGLSTVSGIIRETCDAIWTTLQSEYLPKPTPEIWKSIAEDFANIWNFPHCLGAIDGKHVMVHAPKRSGSEFFNYKQRFSKVLLALVDAQYRFIVVDIGSTGRLSDGGIFAQSKLGQRLHSNSLGIPQPDSIDGCDQNLPYVIVGDQAFPLSTNLMRPYPENGSTEKRKIFNYRYVQS